jgi:predicted PurR-regulated permease PerM
MANRPKPTDARTRDREPSGLSAMLSLLSSAVVVGFLYFARDVIVPITLAVLLSFLLSPAVRALSRLRIGRVAAVVLAVLVACVVILGFAAIVVQEISSLARDLPENRYNLETKVRSIPELVPGGAVFHRVTEMLRDLHHELTKSEGRVSVPAQPLAPTPNPGAKPLPVEIRQPDLEPFQLVQSIVGPLLQPLATAAPVIVFVVMILIDWEDLRDRLLRLGGRQDLHRTTEAMNEAAQRVREYLLRLLMVNITCACRSVSAWP